LRKLKKKSRYASEGADEKFRCTPNVFPTEPLLRENFIFIFSSWKNGKVRRECSEKRPSERYIIPGKMVGQ